MLNYPLTVTKGITFGPIVITCKDDAGVAIPLTGYTPFAEVRESADATAVILNLQPVITNAASGIVTIPTIPKETTRGMTAGVFHWDFILQKPTGERIGPFVRGFFKIKGIITQPA